MKSNVELATCNPAGARQKIEKMSAQVIDTNPYSRLMALERMGVVRSYEVCNSMELIGFDLL